MLGLGQSAARAGLQRENKNSKGQEEGLRVVCQRCKTALVAALNCPFCSKRQSGNTFISMRFLRSFP